MKRVNHSASFYLDEIPDVSRGPDRKLVAIDAAKRDARLKLFDAGADKIGG